MAAGSENLRQSELPIRTGCLAVVILLDNFMTETKQESEEGLSYKQAGVDIAAGDALVEAIKPLAASTRRDGADASLGGFGGLFDIKAAGFHDPILVAATDGVGTKLALAEAVGRHDTIGIDLVAMCVNDLIVQGAVPLFFLDYMATGRLDVAQMTRVVDGIAAGCRQAGAALIGGETAEMPGLYAGSSYDLAGFAVGAAERGSLIDGTNIEDGDVLIGLASSGVHSNGYSLVRRIVEASGAALEAPAPYDDGLSLGESLLTPTRIYVKGCQPAIRLGLVKGLIHITGGGFPGNVPRILPDGLSATIFTNRWQRPAVFDWLQTQGRIAEDEMLRTFNCGIGMVAVVAERHADAALAAFTSAGETPVVIGGVLKDSGQGRCVCTHE